MRVTLVKPPETSKLNFGSFSLAVLAASLRDIADVNVVDATSLSIEDSTLAAMEGGPDVIGVTAMGVASTGPAGDLIKSIRSTGFRGIVIAGGHGASMLPAVLLEAGADAVVCGEGEVTAREIITRGPSEYVRGIALMRGGRVIKTPARSLIEDLDGLMEPSWDLIGEPPDGVYLIETSRGCPHGCAFCEATRFYGKRWRARSPELVARDVARLVKDRGAAIIQITDDNFTASPGRAIEICNLLEGGPLPLFFLFFARSDDVLRSRDLPRALARAHFLRATIGVETLEPDLAESMGKPISGEDHRRAFRALGDAGIFTVATFIVGLPGETEEMREGYVESAVGIGADAAYFLPFQPLPGTPMEKGFGEPEEWCMRAAEEIASRYNRHPKVVGRLIDAAAGADVRGAIARSSLMKLMQSLPEEMASKAAEVIKEMESGASSGGETEDQA